MFTSGDLKPVDDPPMAPPYKLTDKQEEAKEGEGGDEAAESRARNSEDKVSDVKKGKKEPAVVSSETGQKDEEFDEFKDKNGLHYKPNMRVTSVTPVLEKASNSIRQHSSIGDLHGRKQELSKASLNFGGASNISSIVHLETVSAGYYSIDK